MDRARLHNVSKIFRIAPLIEQPNRALDRRRTEVHVPLRRPQVLVAGEFLNRARRRAAHREVRTERMPYVHALVHDLRPTRVVHGGATRKP